MRADHEHAAAADPEGEVCTIPVSGMTCAACSGRVQRQLERTAGVTRANVNLMTGEATVGYDPAAVTPEHLVHTIRETGYGAELPTPDATVDETLARRDAERAAEVRELKGKFGVSIVAAVLTMAFSMPLAAMTVGARRIR